jgi:hypothetical protein
MGGGVERNIQSECFEASLQGAHAVCLALQLRLCLCQCHFGHVPVRGRMPRRTLSA